MPGEKDVLVPPLLVVYLCDNLFYYLRSVIYLQESQLGFVETRLHNP